uniref:Secreted protein n=1 Tax=Globodera rostochiensis TaxID=31243 RepID=A0A914IAN8_GLORO
MESVATLFVLSAIIANLEHSAGLKCKMGDANLNSVETSKVVECPVGNNHYCVASICSREPSTAVILWACTNDDDKTSCAAGAKTQMQSMTQATDYSCNCTFGEKDKDLANAKFTLPQPGDQATKPDQARKSESNVLKPFELLGVPYVGEKAHFVIPLEKLHNRYGLQTLTAIN